jgi:hypothetical protein
MAVIDKMESEAAQANAERLNIDTEARAMPEPYHPGGGDVIEMNAASEDVAIPDVAVDRHTYSRSASTPEPSKGAYIAEAASPASSDVFEDAMTSPRWDHQRTANLTLSSQCTDFDDSSILRALAEVDDQRQPEIADRQQPTLSYQVAPISTPQVLILQSHHNLIQVKETPVTRQTRGHQPQTSSTKSVVLETPGAESQFAIARAINRASTARDTIIVDEDTLYGDIENTRSQKKAARKRASSSDENEDGSKELLAVEERFVREGKSSLCDKL